LRREVEAAVRTGVRGDEAEDVVQATLADVLSATSVPEEPEEFRRFVFGVARTKYSTISWRQKRHTAGLDESETAAPEPRFRRRHPALGRRRAARLRVAEHARMDAARGRRREAEHIARDLQLPATRVRKRVSRLRKFPARSLASRADAGGTLALLCALGALYWSRARPNAARFRQA